MNQSLLDLFQDHVIRNPHHQAIHDGADYATLNLRSTAAAHGLIALGFMPGDVLALPMARGENLIVAMLAAVKAGGSFFPLGTATPPARLENMLRETGANFVLCDPSVALPDGPWKTLIEIPQVKATTPLPVILAETPLCLFHTSGTTGQPKLMPITAAGVLRMAHAPEYIDIKPETRLSHLSNPAFDAISFEIWGALLNGATMVIFDDNDVRDPTRLARKIQATGVTASFMTTAWFNLLAQDAPEVLHGLEDLLFGGEAANPQIIHKLMHHPKAGSCRFSNIYGPTESTTFALVQPLDTMLWQGATHPNTVAIGKPIRDTEAMIVDQDKEVSPGQWGEILLSGQGLTLGYLNNETETKAKFTTLPDHGDTRFYHTGDRGRVVDGAIEYGGRFDHQIKLRGFRIELTEIEAALLAHSQVNAAACGIYDQQLVAFVAASPCLDIAELRASLQARLPNFMLPRHIEVLPTIPLNSNGKIDRSALISPDIPAWPMVAAGQSFLQAGGDSLAAAQFVQHLHEHGKTVAIADLLSDRSLDDVLAQATSTVSPRSVPSHPEKFYPATAEQRGLWILQQMHPDSTAYNIPLQFEFNDAPDPNKILTALNQLIQHHSALRTCFTSNSAGELQANICPPWTIKNTELYDTFNIFDLPFDLGTGQNLRAGLKNNTLFLCLHHIVVDGAALNILLEDFARLYRGECAKLAGDYASYAHQQPLNIRSEGYKTRHKICTKRLSERPFQSRFKSYSPAHNSGQLYHFDLPQTQLTQVTTLAQNTGQTVFSRLFETFALSLWQVGMGQNLSLGLPIGLRPAGQDQTVGMYVNTQVCRFHVSEDMTLRAWNAHVQKEIIALYQTHDVQYADLVEDQRAQGHLGPLFDVMFVHENTRYTLPGLHSEFRFPDVVTPRFPLTFFITETDQGFSCQIEYDTTCFSAEFVKNLADRFADTLTQLGQEDMPIAALQTAPNVLQRIENSIHSAPHKTAVICGENRIDFATLHRKADQYASALHQRGIHPGDRVGLSLAPCLDVVPAILGILRLGATWVPLDPNLPQARLEVMAQDSGISALISDQIILPNIAHLAPRDIIQTASTQYPVSDIDPAALAYIIYTSGSSGAPKGVGVPHSALAHYLAHTDQIYFSGQHIQGAVISTSFSFDATITSLISPLCTSRHVIVIQDNIAENLTKLTRQNTPLLFKVTPTHLTAMHPYLEDVSEVPHLFIVGGEQLPATLVQTMLSYLPQATFINEYGPTEATVGCSIARATAQKLPLHRDVMTIGQPINNMRFSLLHPDGTPVAFGDEGELYISGPGVVPGYINREDLTKSRFVPDPAGGMRYRTGDRALQCETGDYVYLGRMDDQIKFNGYRIEPGEIETALCNVTHITSATVIAIQQQLVAFYTSTGHDISHADLRDTLAKDLPHWMLPTQFSKRDTLPQTPNGKVDRIALRDGFDPLTFVEHVPEMAAAPSVPSTKVDPVEIALLAAFENALGYPIEPNQMFFDVGANSLVLMQVHAKIRRQLVPDLKVIDLFNHPTVSQLSAFISASNSTEKPTVDVENISDEKPQNSGRIAIIGMSTRLPGANNLAEFWDMIVEGREAILHGPSKGAGHVNAVSMLDGPADFDPAYFNLSRKEASLMDPQQRHLLMGTVQALDHAGIVPTDSNRIGLIAGSSENTYQRALMRQNASDLSDYALATLHEKDFLATRIAHLLNLRGPALTVQTACSSSLVAVHQACDMIRAGNADICIAGGVGIDLNLAQGYTHKVGHIFSKNGHCAPFSAGASGTVPANGMGLIVLRDLAEAQTAGDRILAVIEGSAINNDGADKVGFTAPSVQGQTAVISAAHRAANIDVNTLGYIETHGTATPLGDPIEIAALTKAINAVASQSIGEIAIGALKSQIGHMGAGSGIAGLIRTVLSLWHQTLPATLGYDAPHPDIDFEALPFRVNTRAQPWPATRPHAGISSFGMGGTNAHVVIGPAPKPALAAVSRQHMFVFSAKTQTALKARINLVITQLMHGADPLALASALRRGVNEHSWRAGVQFTDIETALAMLANVIPHHINNPVQTHITGPLGAWLSGSSSDVLPQSTYPAAWDVPPVTFDMETCLHQTIAFDANPKTTDRLPYSKWFRHPAWQRIQARPVLETPIITTDGVKPLPVLKNRADIILKTDQPILPLVLAFLQDHAIALRTAEARFIIPVQNAFGPEGVTSPDIAMLSGLLRSACAETAGLRISMIDQRKGDDFVGLPDHDGYAQFALREGRLFQEMTQHINIPTSLDETHIHPGTYVITGGNGGAAAILARKILQTKGTDVMLISRRGNLPKTLQDHPNLDRIELLSIDLSDGHSISEFAQSLRPRAVQLNGIIHAAGTPGGGVLARQSEDQITDTLRSKRDGTQEIMKYLAPLCRDFILLCSSMSARKPAPGQADYAMANAWLDAYSDSCTLTTPKVVSLNWPTWRNTGMAEHLTENTGQLSHIAHAVDIYAIDADEAWQVFNHALSLNIPHVMASPMPADVDINRDQFKHKSAAQPAENLTDIFSQFLDIDPVDCDPEMSFYDLGGDSLLALDLLDDISKKLGFDVPASALSGPMTITALTPYLTSDIARKAQTNNIHILRDGTLPPFVLLHPIGGDIISYRQLVKTLPENRKVIAIEDPFLSDPDAPEFSIPDRAQHYLTQVEDLKGATLVGWSFGALVAFEMAVKAPDAISEIVLIDPPLPTSITPSKQERDAAFLNEITHRKHLGAAPADAPETHPYLDRIASAWRRNTTAMQNYQPWGNLQIPTTLWLAQAQGACAARCNAWQTLLPNLQCSTIPTDHFGILQPPYVADITKHITQSEPAE